jgi:hypothetical protein
MQIIHIQKIVLDNPLCRNFFRLFAFCRFLLVMFLNLQELRIRIYFYRFFNLVITIYGIELLLYFHPLLKLWA